MATVLITGGTGMIGKALTKALIEKGYLVTILTRRKPTSTPDPRITFATWDPDAQMIEPDAIAKTDHIIHLAGANVGEKRWTKKRKKEIVDSRVKSGELLVKSINEIPNRIKSFISASGVGYYGPDPVVPNPHPFTEDMPPHNDFLGQTCVQWEHAIDPLVQMGKRVVIFRCGIALAKEGGALKEFEKPLKFGVATILGSGQQIVSWVFIDDLVRIYIKAIEDQKMSGVYNVAAPYPVSNKKMILQIAKSIKGKYFVPIHVPTFALKMVLGEMSIEILKSATVSCKKLQDAGFTFQYPSIESLDDYFRGRRS